MLQVSRGPDQGLEVHLLWSKKKKPFRCPTPTPPTPFSSLCHSDSLW